MLLIVSVARSAAVAEQPQTSPFSRICVLDTTFCVPKIYVFYPDRLLCVEIKCFDDLTSLTPAQEVAFNFLARTCRERVFSCAEFCANRQISGRNLLLDEYCMQIPFLWRLRCPDDLKQIIQHFKTRMQQAKIGTGSKIPLLISLDYGTFADHLALHRTAVDAAISTASLQLTPQEAEFLYQHFELLDASKATIAFSLYHKVLLQVESMRLASQHWQHAESWIGKAMHNIKCWFKDSRLSEVLYRVFLVQALVIFAQVSGLKFGHRLKNWVLQGAGRGSPGCGTPSLHATVTSDNSSCAASSREQNHAQAVHHGCNTRPGALHLVQVTAQTQLSEQASFQVGSDGSVAATHRALPCVQQLRRGR